MDNNEKPVYTALRDLSCGEWSTKLEAVTDADGRLSFEGFRGTCEAGWNGETGSFVLAKEDGQPKEKEVRI